MPLFIFVKRIYYLFIYNILRRLLLLFRLFFPFLFFPSFSFCAFIANFFVSFFFFFFFFFLHILYNFLAFASLLSFTLFFFCVLIHHETYLKVSENNLVFFFAITCPFTPLCEYTNAFSRSHQKNKNKKKKG